MASSVSPGSRPSFSRISSYSASVRPSSRWRAALDEGAVGNVRSDRLEELAPIGGPGESVDGMLGMGHEAEDVSALVAHAGYVSQRSVRVVPGRVAECHLAVGLEPAELVIPGVEAPGGVLDRDGQALADFTRAREGGVVFGHLELDLAEDEAQRGVGQQRPG